MEPCLSRHARKGGAGDPFIVESLQWESSCRVFPPSCLVILITFLLYCSAPSSPRGGTRSSTSGISSLDNRIFSEIVSFSFFFLLQRFLRKERNIIGARLNFFPSFSSSDRVQINSFHLFLRKIATSALRGSSLMQQFQEKRRLLFTFQFRKLIVEATEIICAPLRENVSYETREKW